MPASVAISTCWARAREIDAPRRLPTAIEIGMDHLAALAFAQNLRQPFGGIDDTINFVA
ncbi:MAG: hypothetical protein ACR2K5_13790 [Pseudolabrys sp.]